MAETAAPSASAPAPDEVSQVKRVAHAQLFDNRLRAAPRLSYAINHHRNIRGEKMRFDDKPYLIALFHDPHPRISVMSCVQMGKTEWLMVSAFYYSEGALQVMYVLPDEVIRNTVVANRIDTVLKSVPYYQTQVRNDSARATDNRSLKHFGKGSIFFASSNAAGTFIEKPLDVILADEMDRFDMLNYEKADDRLSASPYKIKYEAANPTVGSYGIARRYEQSDGRAWHVRCDHCGERQPLDWFENVVQHTGDKSADYRLIDRDWHEGSSQDIRLYCRKCIKPINRLAVGEWVAKYPGRRDHGYHLSKLMGPHIEIAELYDKFRKGLGDDTKLQVFYNSDLGLPYAGVGSKLSDEVLNACCEDYLMPAEAEPCVIGVDVGKRLHVVIRQILPGERLRAVFIGTVPDFEDLDILMARFKTVAIAIDALPETRKVREFIARHPHISWMVRYQQKIVDVNKDDEKRVLTIDRTQAMDRVLSFFLRKSFVNPRNAQSLDHGDYYRLLKAPTRLYDGDDNRFNWLGDPDHYFHAEVYALLAYVARGEFRVWGVNLAGGAANAQPPPADEAALLKRFPPGTDPRLVEHYRRLYHEMVNGAGGPDKMIGAFQGEIKNGQ